MAAKKAGLLVLSEQHVAHVLDKLSTEEILSTIGRALYTMSAHARSDSENIPAQGTKDVSQTPTVQNPLRITTTTPNHTILYMPSRLGSSQTTSIKVVSVPRHANDKAGLPATTLMFDEKSGECRAVINARSLTAVRTAAASALALSSSKCACEAKTLLIYGAGLQALWHARLVSALSPQLKEVVLASRKTTSRATKLAESLSAVFANRDINVSSCSFEEAAEEGGAVSRADLICCCTPSTVPLFPSHNLKKRVAVSLIGSYKPHMQEIDLVPLAKSGRLKRAIVDSREACLAEAGEIQRLVREQRLSEEEQIGWLPELGFLVTQDGCMSDRVDEDVLVFKSVGVGVMDAAISALVLEKATELSEYGEVSF